MMSTSDYHTMERVGKSYSDLLSWRENKRKDLHYISSLWKQQREVMNRNTVPTREREKYRVAILDQNDSGYYNGAPEIANNYQPRQMFPSRNGHRFNRQKTLVLATAPEQHRQIDKVRTAQRELRNKPKAPIRLEPIDVKPLKNTITEQKESGQHLSYVNKLSKSFTFNSTAVEMLAKPSTINSLTQQDRESVTLSDIDVLRSLATRLNNNYKTSNRLSKMSQVPKYTSSNHVSHMRQHLGTSRFSRHGINYGGPPQTRTPTHIKIDLRARNCHSLSDSLDSSDVTSSVTKTSCCNQDDEDCIMCGKYSTQFQILPLPSKSLPTVCTKSDQTPSTSSSLPTTKKSLVIQLPDINCTPATPTMQQLKSRNQKKNLPVNASKAIKQREVRRRELNNLFTDIAELSHVNTKIVNILQEPRGSVNN